VLWGIEQSAHLADQNENPVFSCPSCLTSLIKGGIITESYYLRDNEGKALSLLADKRLASNEEML